MKNLEEENILIIGNGFDLQLGLKSEFSDFIKNTYFPNNKIDIRDLYLQSKIYKFDPYVLLKLWFLGNKNESVKDIKKCLNQNYFIFAYVYFKFLEYNSKFPIVNEIQIDDSWSDVETGLKQILLNRWKISRSGEVRSLILPKSIKIDRLKSIRNSLNDFEKKFNNYLISLTKHDYQEKLTDHLEKFIKRFKINSGIQSWWFINFNYTKIDNSKINHRFSKLDVRDALLITSHNIHGYIIDDQNNKLKSNIIIGIDDTNGNTEDIRNNINERFPEFTKSYRKVLLNSIHQKYSFEDQKIIALPLHSFFCLPSKQNNTRYKIYFYGHSLSENDYSYFQAIFDKYDLYSSNTELHFVYPPNKEDKTTPDPKRCNYLSIYKLIHKYGKSLDNKEKGNNLFSKLILENRLIIDIIDWDHNE